MRARKVIHESISLYDAKTHLSSLVERTAAGEVFVITKSGRPRARLVPVQDIRATRVSGRGRGAWKVASDFDAPLPGRVLDDFEGGR